MNEHAAIRAAQIGGLYLAPVGEREPARRLKRLHLHRDLRVVLVLQAVLEHLELQRADRADDVAVKPRTDLLKELNRALLRQLLDAFDELLALHRILCRDACETLGREHGEVLELELVRGVAERIADAEYAGVKQPHDVARVRRVDDLAILRKELLRLSELDELAARRVPDAHIAVEFARGDADKGEAIAVRGVHIRLNLKDESRELLIIRRNHTIRGIARCGCRRETDILLKEVLHAEIRHRRAEEHRRQLPRINRRAVKRLACVAQQLDVVRKGGGSLRADTLLPRGIIHLKHLGDARLLPVARILGKELDAVLLAVIDAAIRAVRSDRPVHRVGADAEHVLELVHEIERRLAEAVKLVDKGKDGDAALTADAEQLARLRLDALCRVDDHDGTVHRHQRAVRVLTEVLMPRRVEDVDPIAVIVELQHGGRDRDAALFFDLHPVGDGMTLRLARLDRAREMYRPAVEQQLLGERRLARVRMRDDGKGASLRDLAVEFFFQSSHKSPLL